MPINLESKDKQTMPDEINDSLSIVAHCVFSRWLPSLDAGFHNMTSECKGWQNA